jgi:hypothetical protein
MELPTFNTGEVVLLVAGMLALVAALNVNRIRRRMAEKRRIQRHPWNPWVGTFERMRPGRRDDESTRP